jgi:hypothetical protein
MPDQNSTGLQDASKLADHPRIVGWIVKEPKRREEIYDAIEASGPHRRKLAHVRPSVVKRWAATALKRSSQQLSGIIDAVYAKACFGEQVRMAPLPTWRIEDARANGKSEHVDDARGLGSIPLRGEDRRVLEKVVRIEIAFPPLRLSTQKNTGSRYAPKTSSIAARIS